MIKSIKSLLVLILLLAVAQEGNLIFTCGVENCSSLCGSNTCLKYTVPIGDQAIEKCRTSADCSGVTTGTYNLFQCSDVADPTGTYICKDQCCYFHQLQRRNVCLAPAAIGLVKDQYKTLCSAASRNLYKQLQDLKKQLEQKKNREFILTLCGIIFSGLSFLITIPFLVIKACQHYRNKKYSKTNQGHQIEQSSLANNITPQVQTQAH